VILHFESDSATGRLEGRVPVQVLEAVDRALTYAEAGAYFSPAYKLGHWDGKRRLFDMKRQEFPAGLEDRILAVLEKMIPDFDIVDERPTIEYEPEKIDAVTLNGVELYPVQREALHAFYSSGARGCMELPTNFGKTECAAAILKLQPGPALVLIDSKSLVAQTAHRLKQRLGEKIGIFGGGEKNTSHRITVATIQAIWHHFAKLRKSFLPGIQTLIVDEAHKVSPKMWFNVLGEVGASVRLGLSATIREASRRMVVESYLGPIVHTASVQEMIDEGRAAKPTIRMLRLGGLVRATDPQAVYEEGVVRNRERNRLICEAAVRCVADGKAPLILVVRIEHGEAIRDMLEDRGLSIPFLHGQTDMDTITLAKARFGTSRVPGIIASTIFDMGQDMPSIRALILAGGQRSPLRTIQRVGRSLRKKLDGDNTVQILDIYDQSCRMLQSQSDERLRTYRRKYGNDVKLIQRLDDLFNPVPSTRQPVA
jgi:superfamily II DNA or RNA helicase